MLADLGLILLLILLNGLFVAAEIAFVTVRRTRLDELADEGIDAPRARCASSKTRGASWR